MIVKDKEINSLPADAKLKAGIQQEQDVAFYLRRSFKNRDDVFVFNDLRIEHDGETAQIDHLILTELGFCLVESKSIRAEVNVNRQGEWTRIYNGKKEGMKSPIKQVEMQSELLKNILRENAEQLLGKMFGVLQQGFGGRYWKSICAVSSDAVIDRTYMDNDVNNRVLKSEFVAEWINDEMSFGEGISRKIKILRNSAPFFSEDEMKAISNFLMDSHRPLDRVFSKTKAQQSVIKGEKKEEPIQDDQKEKTSNLKTSSYIMECKKCHQTNQLTAEYGKFGYYVHCACDTNTSMKQNCKSCGKPMTIKKEKEKYFAGCECGVNEVIFTIT